MKTQNNELNRWLVLDGYAEYYKLDEEEARSLLYSNIEYFLLSEIGVRLAGAAIMGIIKSFHKFEGDSQ